MVLRLDSLQRSAAFAGALLFTAVLVFASSPVLPVA